MQKGENIVTIALAAVVLLAVIAVQRRWNPASLKDVASSAEDFILTTTGIGGQVPDIAGYERLQTFRLGKYRAGLYRATPAPLVFSPGRFVIYDQNDQPVFRLETLEGSKDPWTTLYNFSGRHGLSVAGSRARATFTRALTGNNLQNVIIGQYSGGDHCCTVATIIELGANAVSVVGRIEGLDGLPFEGLEIRNIRKDKSWECVAHRPYTTTCGDQAEPADVLSVYTFTDGHYVDTTAQYKDYLTGVLNQNLAKWRQEKGLSLGLLQTLAAQFAQLGSRDEGKRFFAMNFNRFLPNLQQRGIDPNVCLDDLENLMNRLPGVPLAAGQEMKVESQEPKTASQQPTVNRR